MDPMMTHLCSAPDALFAAGTEETGIIVDDNSISRAKMNFVSYFGAEVTDYYCEGDGSSYNDHCFSLKVWIAQKIYSISRSYAAFCELDAQLRKKYPRTVIPSLPLAAASYFVRMPSMSQRAFIQNNEHSKSSATDLRQSMINRTASQYSDAGGRTASTASANGRSKSMVTRRVDTSETISQKRGPLNAYLAALFLLPEVLLSDNILYFLDEESVDGRILSATPVEVSEADILLANEPPSSKVVLRQLQLPLEITPDSVIVWNFTTLYYDIGFSIKYNDTVILPYQRYPTCVEAVKGSIYVPQAGKVVLTWDNSYSRMRSKFLTYTVRVFTKSSFETARAIAMEAVRERELLSQQRATLKKYLLQASRNLLSLSGSESVAIPHISLTRNSFSLGASDLDDNADALTSPLGLHRADEVAVEYDDDADAVGSDGAGVSSRDSEAGPDSGRGSTVKVTRYHRAAVSEVDRLKDEKSCLQRVLSESEQALVEERSACAVLIERLEKAQEAAQKFETENNDLRGRLELLEEQLSRQESEDQARNGEEVVNSYQSNAETVAEADAEAVNGVEELEEIRLTGEGDESHGQAPLDSSHTDRNCTDRDQIESSRQIESSAMLELKRRLADLSDQIGDLQAEVLELRQEKNSLEAQATKLKSERKVLKDFAVKSKMEKEGMEQQLLALQQQVNDYMASKSVLEPVQSVRGDDTTAAAKFNACTSDVFLPPLVPSSPSVGPQLASGSDVQSLGVDLSIIEEICGDLEALKQKKALEEAEKQRGQLMLSDNFQTDSSYGRTVRPAATSNQPIISDETVELVDELVAETSAAAAAAMSSIWNFGKSLLNEGGPGAAASPSRPLASSLSNGPVEFRPTVVDL